MLRQSALLLCVIALVVDLSLGLAASALADWNDFSTLLQVAAQAEVTLEVPAKLELSQLTPLDALIWVGPERQLPVSELTDFLRQGGRLALLDDFGTGDRLLAAYQVTRTPADPAGIPKLRDDPNLLVAYPAHEHPLSEGVPLLLTNRASELHHPDLRPIFAFGGRSSGLVLSGSVGAGRFIAIGDASLFIDQLMRIEPHRRFALNLVNYLARPGGRILLITARTEVSGSYGGRKSGLSRFDTWLRQASHPDLPANALAVLGASALAIAATLGLSIFPRRSPYVRPDVFPSSEVRAGYGGKVRLGGGHRGNLIWQALDYRRELEAGLCHAAGLAAGAGREALLTRLRARGLDEHGVERLAQLLDELEALERAAEAEGATPDVGEAQLHDMVRSGEQLLHRIGEHTA